MPGIKEINFTTDLWSVKKLFVHIRKACICYETKLS